MEGKEPSRTARIVAGVRAVHQTLDGGAVFADPFARAIADEESLANAEDARTNPSRRLIYLGIIARSRFADDALGAAVARGVRQAVVLGAGLDTLGLRNPYAERGLRVFEVDHPATQAWKRERLAQAGLAIPASLTFAPVDFERQSLADGLRTAGFRTDQPAFFIWLGVTYYLTREAIAAALRFIAGVPEAEVVFDYVEPRENFSPAFQATFDAAAARVAKMGEPLITHFDPAALAAELGRLGFTDLEDVTLSDLIARLFGLAYRTDEFGAGGAHFVRARRLS